MWKFLTQTTTQPKTILASVRFNVCVMLFSMNWTSGQAVVKGWASWPLVPEVKNHTDCKPKWRSSAWWRGGNLPSPPQPLTSLNMWSLPPSISFRLSHFWTLFFGILEGITNLLVPGLRLKTSLCATSLYFSEEKWECVYNPCVYCQLVLHALWPYDWSNCVLCTVTNCLLKLWFDWSEGW